MVDIPKKRYFRIGEVSKLVGVEPHVIRYWETEFDNLSPTRAGSKQRLYTREDVTLLLRIERLLHIEKYTIAGAKLKLVEQDQEQSDQVLTDQAVDDLAGGQANDLIDDLANDLQADETEAALVADPVDRAETTAANHPAANPSAAPIEEPDLFSSVAAIPTGPIAEPDPPPRTPVLQSSLDLAAVTEELKTIIKLLS